MSDNAHDFLSLNKGAPMEWSTLILFKGINYLIPNFALIALGMEFLFTRILLCSSFSRMCRIEKREERKEALKKNWELLQVTFPKWHSNKYLKALHTKRGYFMQSVNCVTYSLYSCFFVHFYNR